MTITKWDDINHKASPEQRRQSKSEAKRLNSQQSKDEAKNSKSEHMHFEYKDNNWRRCKMKSNWKSKLPKNRNKDDQIAALQESVDDLKQAISSRDEIISKWVATHKSTMISIKKLLRHKTRLEKRLDATLFAMCMMQDSIRRCSDQIEELESSSELKLAT